MAKIINFTAEEIEARLRKIDEIEKEIKGVEATLAGV